MAPKKTLPDGNAGVSPGVVDVEVGESAHGSCLAVERGEEVGMVRQLARRLLRGGALASALVALGPALPYAGPAAAALDVAHAAGPDSITISGPGLDQLLTVRAGESRQVFAALLGEVSWLSSRPSKISEPDAAKLGDKYVLTVFIGAKPTRRFELYPLAAGGPRVFRPANQPDKRPTTAAWFYGRLSVPDSLRDAGVPLAGPASTVTTGGIGGGQAADKPFDPNADLTSLLAQWRQFLLLNGAVVVVIALGLAGTSLLVRRRVDRLYRRVAEGRAPVRRR